MAPGCPSVGGVAPFDLIESGQRIAQVRDIQVPICVVMGEVPQRLPFGRGFDHREGRIRKLFDVLPTPFRGIGGGSSQQHYAKGNPDKPSHAHHCSPPPPVQDYPAHRDSGTGTSADAIDAASFL